MIKRLFILMFLIGVTANLAAQNYGNEWINYNQKHYRIPISKTGLYRINFNTLIGAGIPLASINPKNFQVFIKGEEQFIYLNGEADNIFDPTDYIEFYAKKNDGVFDSLAYNDIIRLPNPYVSLFNDTNFVFLTWNNSTTNKRAFIESDINFTGYSAANYFYTEKIEAYSNSYSLGPTFLDVISDPRYVTAEGFGNTIAKGQSQQTNFGNLNLYSSSLPVYIKASYSGSNTGYNNFINFDHQLKLYFLDNTGSYSAIHDTTFTGAKQFLIEKQITASQLQNNSNLRITSENNPLITSNNYTNIHYLYFKYPQIPSLSNTSEHRFFINDNVSSAKTFIDIQNVNVGSSQVILYDLTNHKYISTVVSGTNVKALIPNSSSQKECFLTTTANINLVPSLKPVNQTGYFLDYRTNNPDSAFVIITHQSLQSAANDYKTYRQSVNGGSNHVILADIDDLYDQFAYGNTKNPLAIKNFCRFLSDSLPVPPKYLLLLGKSIKQTIIKNSSSNWTSCKVPTIGNPSSDNNLTSGIHGSHSSVPFIPVGRVSANNTMDIVNYLNKVKSHESGLRQVPPDDWHKHILHFSGGADAAQQSVFAQYLKSYADIIIDTLYGGTVYSFGKNTSAPIQITVSDSVTNLINYGASLITFFGHGSVTGFDQAIDNPNAFNNKDKYPLFIANSCYSGDIHIPGSSSTSESFTLIDQKGSIGFIASSASGVDGTLNVYSTAIYKSLAYETYYKGVGDAIKNATIKTLGPNNPLQEITNLEMTLEGDPSIKINAFSKPDYAINNSSISFDPFKYVDSIGVQIVVKNNGKAIRDTFVVKTERYFPSGDSTTYYKKIAAPFNCDTLGFYIFKDLQKGVGLNHFKVNIDYYNEINELTEMNNSTNGFVDLFISGGDVIPVYPYKYAIIPNTPQITLKASTADPLALSANYKIQLDTNDTFINPINSTVITSIGGVIQWTVNLPFADSTVYFWRISKDSVTTTDRINWRESSFQVIGSKNGWAQAHFHQFKLDNYQFIKYNKPQRRFDFFNDLVAIKCYNFYGNAVNYADLKYVLNTTVESNWHFAFNGWSVAVFDSISIKPWKTRINGNSGYASPYNNCLAFADQDRASFDFGQTTYCGPNPNNWKTDLLNFLNAIPQNNYVLAYSSDAHYASTYSNALYQAFESFGSANIRNTSDSLPMIIFGKKGNAIGQANELIGTAPSSSLTLSDSIRTRWNSGYIESEIIGPAYKWNSLHWNYVAGNVLSNDSIKLKLVGLHINGSIDTLATFRKDSLDVLDLYNYVNASSYPNIKLVALMSDNSFHSTPQLKKWQVIYDPVPECAINPQQGYTNNASIQAIQEGDNLIVHLPIENIGKVAFTDSIVVTYWIEDANRVNHTLPQTLKAKPFVPNQVIIDTIQFNSHNFPGYNYLWVNVNPENNSRYQLEQYHFNNIARIGFNVTADNINPLLDVTFDGAHILNGDIISSKPYVLVSLKDENKFLALNDTSNFNVFIKYPNQTTEKRLFFARSLQFIPAQLPNNSCKIEWKPEFAEDGKYTLIVQATDRSKNVSGAIDYNIQFEVINKQTVTEVLNYPNPFSTSTRFVFTLTGSEIPDIFTIQIMTISGKVVKEITKNELGNLRIGRNITDYAWDGKDEFGDKLANGVYLYKVITRSNGKAVEKNQTDADSFFKKGIGKMVIIR